MNHEPVTDALFDDVIRAEMDATRAAGGGYPELIRVRTEGTYTGGLYYAGYSAKDGGIILGALTKTSRDAFRKLLGLEDEPSDQPGHDVLDPENQRLALHFKEVMRTKMRERTVAEWIEIFDAAGLPAAPVNFPEEIATTPQVRPKASSSPSNMTSPAPSPLSGPSSRCQPPRLSPAAAPAPRPRHPRRPPRGRLHRRRSRHPPRHRCRRRRLTPGVRPP